MGARTAHALDLGRSSTRSALSALSKAGSGFPVDACASEAAPLLRAFAQVPWKRSACATANFHCGGRCLPPPSSDPHGPRSIDRSTGRCARPPTTGRRPRMTRAHDRQKRATPAAVHVVRVDPHPAPRARTLRARTPICLSAPRRHLLTYFVRRRSPSLACRLPREAVQRLAAALVRAHHQA